MSFDRFFCVEGLGAVGDEVTLDSEEARHLVSVYRASAGREVTLFDGRGGEARARVIEAQKRSARLELLECRNVDRRPEVVIELAVALPRGGAADDVLRRALEVGAGVIQPIETRRSVHRATRKEDEKRRERFRRLAIASMKLSGRNSMPRLLDPLSFDDYLVDASSGASTDASQDSSASRFFGATSPLASRLLSVVAAEARPRRAQLVIGPEGGLTEGEAEQLEARAFRGISFGPLVLRVESAVAVGVGMLAAW